MHPRLSHYRAFMLRMWQDNPDQDWRYWLEDVSTGQRCAFANVGDLCAYLQLFAAGLGSPQATASVTEPPEPSR